jgi:hypothetical protein
MQIVELLYPEAFTLDGFRMATRLPEASFSVRARGGTQCFHEALGEMFFAVVA